MQNLSFPISAAKLRQITHLKAKRNNFTRWSSTYDMVARYHEIRDSIPDLDIPDIESILHTVRENGHVDSLAQQLGDLNSITIELQK